MQLQLNTATQREITIVTLYIFRRMSRVKLPVSQKGSQLSLLEPQQCSEGVDESEYETLQDEEQTEEYK